MKFWNKNQIKNLTYDGKILESDGRISGFIIGNDGKEKLKIWVPVDNNVYYTDDKDYYDKWLSDRNNITVNQLKAMRLKTKNRVNSYFPNKKR